MAHSKFSNSIFVLSFRFSSLYFVLLIFKYTKSLIFINFIFLFPKYLNFTFFFINVFFNSDKMFNLELIIANPEFTK